MRDYSVLVETDRRKVEVLDKLRYLLNMSYENDYGIDMTFKEVKRIMKEVEDL